MLINNKLVILLQGINEIMKRRQFFTFSFKKLMRMKKKKDFQKTSFCEDEFMIVVVLFNKLVMTSLYS